MENTTVPSDCAGVIWKAPVQSLPLVLVTVADWPAMVTVGVLIALFDVNATVTVSPDFASVVEALSELMATEENAGGVSEAVSTFALGVPVAALPATSVITAVKTKESAFEKPAILSNTAEEVARDTVLLISPPVMM